MIDQMREYKTLNMFFPKNKGRNDTILIKIAELTHTKFFWPLHFSVLVIKTMQISMLETQYGTVHHL